MAESKSERKEKSVYDEDSIKSLDWVEHIRLRPGMYIGKLGNGTSPDDGIYVLFKEIVDNSVDEALAGFCTNVDVTLHPDGSVTVVDNGRGIPVDNVPKYRKSGVEVVLTVLHAGGKFGDGGYKVSGGLHGVGVSVVNALSSQVRVRVKRDGTEYQMTFADGYKASELEVVGTVVCVPIG